MQKKRAKELEDKEINAAQLGQNKQERINERQQARIDELARKKEELKEWSVERLFNDLMNRKRSCKKVLARMEYLYDLVWAADNELIVEQ